MSPVLGRSQRIRAPAAVGGGITAAYGCGLITTAVGGTWMLWASANQSITVLDAEGGAVSAMWDTNYLGAYIVEDAVEGGTIVMSNGGPVWGIAVGGVPVTGCGC